MHRQQNIKHNITLKMCRGELTGLVVK